jgi:hypothetical protein
VHIGGLQMAAELLPAPQPDEVVPALKEKVQVGVVVEALRFIGTLAPKAEPVVEVVVDM